MVAKVTQERYGYKRLLANLLILEKALIVKKILTQRARISNIASNGFLMPKKIIDHKAFKTS